MCSLSKEKRKDKVSRINTEKYVGVEKADTEKFANSKLRSNL